MSNTFTLVLRSTTTPDGATISVCLGPDWNAHIPCTYDADNRQWQSILPLPASPEPLQFKFICDGTWQLDPNLQINAEDLPNAIHIYDDRSVCFDPPGSPFIDMPLPAWKFFDEELSRTDEPYDLIVIGSGAGGGTLAYEACRSKRGEPQRVLVLEAGSYLFPVHIQNLPRRDSTTSGSTKGLWELWYQFWVPRTVTSGGVTDGPNSQAAMAQALNLGGRTLFWGALAPRMKNWEFSSWPPVVGTELRDTWYERAEQLMRVQQGAPSAYQADVRGRLERLPQLRGFQHVDAPLAIEFQGRSRHTVPAGAFSTAELLIERKIQVGPGGDALYPNLHVRLGHEVTKIDIVANGAGHRTATAVVAYDHRQGCERTFALANTGSVVLAAGTLATPLIAQASDFASNPLIGQGLTDHPVYIVSFTIPRRSPWFNEYESSITLSRPGDPESGRPDHPFNVKLSLNTRLTQSRFVVPGDPAAFIQDNEIACELVFMLEGALQPSGTVVADGSSLARPVIHIERVQVDRRIQAAMDRYAHAVIRMLQGRLTKSFYAPLGGVCHEVGTMRMTAGELGVVDDNLKLLDTTNIYVCDLSVFPSSPAANPTLTLVAMALRLADRLSA